MGAGPQQYCYVEFAVNSEDRFAALSAAFMALKHDKDMGAFRDETDWLEFFNDEALSHFWWPTRDEFAAHTARWQAAPVDVRLRDILLNPPSWDFTSLLAAFENGEYALVACRRLSDNRARLEFNPYSYPYGGADCMHMLVEAFGFQVLAEDDGTGYRSLSDDVSS